MQNSQESNSRKKFLLWTATALTSFTVFKFLSADKKKEEKPSIKMLTQDGTLVEVDQEMIIQSARKISDKELQQWVKK
mgnify:CR=1 FL=1